MSIRSLRIWYVLAALVVLAQVNPAHGADNASSLCKIYAKAGELLSPKELLPWKELSKDQWSRLREKWACLKGYSWGFPGGEDRFLQANPQALRADLNRLRALFDTGKVESSLTPEEAKGMKRRQRQIAEGFDREQVILWGSAWLIRNEYKDGDYQGVLKDVAKVRSEFGLDAKPIESWDDAQDNTYFSPRTLRNMIVVFELLAKAETSPHTRESVLALARDYVRQREALRPIFQITANADEMILGPLCQR